jgi:hypothetical protein
MKHRTVVMLSLFVTSHAVLAFDVAGLKPGMSRAETAKVLAPLFPAQEALETSTAQNETALFNVNAYDTGCSANTCLAQYSEQNLQTRMTIRSASVAASFNREDRLESIRLERLTMPASGQCTADVESALASSVARFGEPANSSRMSRSGIETHRHQWGDCATGGECFLLEYSCGRRGEATITHTLSNYRG